MTAPRTLASAALAAATLACLASPAAADHTLQRLVSPPGSAQYDWVVPVITPEKRPQDRARFLMSADGSRVILQSAEPFDSADTDTQMDLYARVGDTFELLTTGPAGGNGPFYPGQVDASLDRSRVVFETHEALVPEDRDFLQDVYERSGGVTTLVSTGDFAGSGLFNAYLNDISEDGTKVFFSTAETITADDVDGGYRDVFERSSGDTTLVSTAPGSDGSHDATFEDASADGSRVLFTTAAPLVGGDTDQQADIYERAGGTTTLISTGPVDGPGDHPASFNVAARHGGRVIFTTGEQLVAQDTDTRWDLYERAGGTTRLISTSPMDANGPNHAFFGSASEDAAAVVFETNERLVAEHTNSSEAAHYRWSDGQIDLIGREATESMNNFNPIISGDGSHVFFWARRAIVPEDLDGDSDVYGWHDGVTELVSTGPGDTHTTFAYEPTHPSFDGERVFFRTGEPLVPGDPDGTGIDLFERVGDTTFQVSPPGPGTGDGVAATNRDGTNLLLAASRPLVPEDTDGAQQDLYLFAAPATAFTTSLFTSPAAADSEPPSSSAAPAPAGFTTPPSNNANGKLALQIGSRIATVEPDGTGFHYVTGEAEIWARAPAWSPDGSRLAFWSGSTEETPTRLGAIDPGGGNLVWSSEAHQDFGATHPAWSPDGETLAFVWRSRTVLACDGIGITRVDGTESRLIVPQAQPCDKQDLDWSPDGERIAFSAGEESGGSPDFGPLEIYSVRSDGSDMAKLTDEEPRATNPDWSPDGSKIAYHIPTGDFHPRWDVIRIDRDGSGRTRLFPGSSPRWSPDSAELAFVDSDSFVGGQDGIDSVYLDIAGGRQIFRSDVGLTEFDWQPVPGGQKGHVRPKGASPLRLSLVPAYHQCGAPNREHAPPLSFPSCNPPVQRSDHLTVGTPDANGQPAVSTGFLRFRPLVGDPGTPADEADVRIASSVTDVRCRTAIAPCAAGTLSDYTGGLRVRLVVRMTDRLNALGHAITTQSIPLTAPIPCTQTPASAAGSSCSTVTTLEAIVPGAVPEGKRSNWELDQVTIFDGGSDGDPETGVDTPFAVPGVFVP